MVVARARKKLTAREVTALSSPGFHSDGNRLYLAIDANGRKRWIFRYQLKGKQRDMGLGIPLDVSLAEARAKADEANGLLRQGMDPLEHKRPAAMEQDAPTFGQFVEVFFGREGVRLAEPKTSHAMALNARDLCRPVARPSGQQDHNCRRSQCAYATMAGQA